MYSFGDPAYDVAWVLWQAQRNSEFRLLPVPGVVSSESSATRFHRAAVMHAAGVALRSPIDMAIAFPTLWPN